MHDPKPIVSVLDDEPEMRKALGRLLTGRGFCVREHAGGNDFLAATGSPPPDCLLLDLHMPEVSGFEVLEAIRCRHLDLPVIIITAHDEPGTAERVRALGACAYLKKPIDRDVLLSAIKAAMDPARIRRRQNETFASS